jgi:hypothetical protein
MPPSPRPVPLLPAASVALMGLLTACATNPPANPDDACLIFEEKADWYEAAKETETHWGVPIQVQLAIIRQESSFRHDAKPPRARFLGIPLWWRSSSAYGYAQVKDATWDWYRDKTGNGWASRDDFADASDFIGWYTDLSRRTLGISKWDAYNQYLAYHEGHGGWKRKSYEKKPWLIQVARRVDTDARNYGAQLRGCREGLDAGPGWWPF